MARPTRAQLVAQLLERVGSKALNCGRVQGPLEVAFGIPAASELLDDDCHFATILLQCRPEFDLAVDRLDALIGSDKVRELSADVVFKCLLCEACEEITSEPG